VSPAVGTAGATGRLPRPAGAASTAPLVMQGDGADDGVGGVRADEAGRPGALGVDEAGGDGVDADAAGGELDGQDLGQAEDGGLGRGVQAGGGRGRADPDAADGEVLPPSASGCLATSRLASTVPSTLVSTWRWYCSTVTAVSG